VSDQPHYSVSVAGVVINDDGDVLLIQRRDNGHWEPPGGILELDEAIKDGVRREVREETGLEVEPETLTGVYKNMPRGIVSLVFRCRVVGGTLTETPEARAARWVKSADVASLAANAFAIRVLDGVRGDPVPAIREHDGTNLL
jgi:8-oxo-dGTP diphosphatase